MKIHKTAPGYNLEAETRAGWELVQILGASRAEKVECKNPLAVAGSPGNPQQGYQATPGWVNESVKREEVVQVHEPVFLLAKDAEADSREAALLAELRAERDKVKLLEEKHRLNERDQKDLTKKVEDLTKKVEEQATEARRLETQYTHALSAKREAVSHLTKIRTAIGTVRYDEIVGG